jgi:hypothetical protein
MCPGASGVPRLTDVELAPRPAYLRTVPPSDRRRTTSRSKRDVPTVRPKRPPTAPPKRATLDRAQELVDALVRRALRFERVLEVLDLRAARSSRKLAERVHVAVALWSESDEASRSAAHAELVEIMEAAEMLLLVGDAPAPSTERRAPPISGVEASDDDRSPDDASPAADANAWQAALGVPRRRR